MAFELAQLNIARLDAPFESEQLADFVGGLDRINALAETAPGFLWRLVDESSDPTAAGAFAADEGDGHGVLVNMSVWTGLDALADFVFRTAHVEFLRRRREWFQPLQAGAVVLWWVPAGHRPSVGEAAHRLAHLREHGPTAAAFTLRRNFPAPDAHGPAAGEVVERDDLSCPA